MIFDTVSLVESVIYLINHTWELQHADRPAVPPVSIHLHATVTVAVRRHRHVFIHLNHLNHFCAFITSYWGSLASPADGVCGVISWKGCHERSLSARTTNDVQSAAARPPRLSVDNYLPLPHHTNDRQWCRHSFVGVYCAKYHWYRPWNDIPTDISNYVTTLSRAVSSGWQSSKNRGHLVAPKIYVKDEID